VGDDADSRLRLERRSNPLVAEPHALELRPLVLERKVRVPRARDRDPTDLALDPQVAQLVVGADGRRDRACRLGDGDAPDPDRRRQLAAAGVELVSGVPRPNSWLDVAPCPSSALKIK